MRILTIALLMSAMILAGRPVAGHFDAPALRMVQSQQRAAEFDVVSIKRNTSGSASGGIRTTPDGTVIMTNQPMRSLIDNVSSEPVLPQNILGMPDWMTGEKYDVTVKPPVGATREMVKQMWKAMFAERMKLVAHNEQREQTTYTLTLARADGKLGPQLTPSLLDCSPRPASSSPQPPANAVSLPSSLSDYQNRCGIANGATEIVSGGITMEGLARSLIRQAGGPVTNRTGLQGFYAVKLTFAMPRLAGAPQDAVSDNAPDFFTALQEQLGLKLQPEKGMVMVLVIDQIERPTDN